ncbi:terminase [Croceibacterium xixiisoli]|uniref:terminase n=1 Tax=Croceibacterium xixiisoli TaxID=1476466 RepID=UPI0019293BEA|nr:terminase [Croceibacterium xixiisoli]
MTSQARLAEDIGGFTHDPLGYALYAFPWGTGELAGVDGPRAWQREQLGIIGAHLGDPERRHRPCRIAVASGHGIGKSALIGMIVKWGLDTCPDARVVVTANTERQLTTKTGPEIAKWARLAVTAPWFRAQARSLVSTMPGSEQSWRADLVAWSEHSTEAFAGLHNQGRRIIVIYDEASGIADKVWEVTLGALTDEATEILWIAFGNPTQNSGAFRECFGRQRHLWHTAQIDSRTVEGTNKPYLDELIATYGEDSDIARVRVRGQFPAAASMQFIAGDMVTAAQARVPAGDSVLAGDPVIFGLDCARFGDDHSVLAIRCGRDAVSRPWQRWHGVDAMTLAGDVALAAGRWHPDAIMVDAGNIGAAVIDRLRQLAPDVPVYEVWFGGKGRDAELEPGMSLRCRNKRAEIWAQMRHWLRHGSIPSDQQLHDDLTGPHYGFDADQRLTIERKPDMKKRGLASPDAGDALACTFAEPVLPRSLPEWIGAMERHGDGDGRATDRYREL